MKGLFKSKPRTPPDIVRQTHDLLAYADRSVSIPDLRESKRQEKLSELSKNLRELKLILYGNSDAEPVAEAYATQVVANLQRQQQVNSRLVASDYLESNTDLMDVLVDGYVLDSQHELLTRHKSTVAEFLTKNEEWFFADFNSKLLESIVGRYITGSVKLSCDDEISNQKKPSDIINVLVANRNKLLRLLADLKLDKEDESFEADKAHVVSEIASLKPRDLA
ncbi:hypothetical protein F2Q68_00037081 [Brassica cretica]|uniref:Uncharacterized protein n=1 Tax=Brassica cretica TaxID=69181 RepID=A0A8S9H5L9_BRACR|nr:hypothetical protein F2Q68_00037081 [Brassica cretica]